MPEQGISIARDETERLIASNKVEGTSVYNRSGRKIGSIHNFMVEKVSGRVEYAVLTAGGGLLGSARYYPLPWDVLTYSTERGGYVVDFDPAHLDGAPSYEGEDQPRFDRDYDKRVRGHYGDRSSPR
jgi:sporulation protein YlmC with PRC-barrel domain